MDLFEQTRTYHQQGDYEKAVAGYEAMLAEDPQNPQLCYLLALVYFELSLLDEAAKWFKKTISYAPEATPAYYNLGVIAFEQEKFAEAADFYKQAHKLNPEDSDTLFNLALTWKKLGVFDKALACYEHALSMCPNDQDILYNLGVLHKDMEQPHKAIVLFEKVIAANPEHPQALNNLGYLYHRQDEVEKAIAIFKKLMEIGHNATMAAHMLAALTGDTTATAPDSYVRDVFDSFSDHYDESLVDKLGYTTPAMLKEMLEELHGRHFQRTLDMGCGTGLSGEAFKDMTKELIGLDLSKKMLDVAAQKGLYNSLHETDIVSFLRETEATFDLFLAADVFVYIGELAPIFELVAQKASKGAIFLFSTELADSNFTLKPTGRYGHAELYIRELAQEHGFKVLKVKTANIRKEKGVWIIGNLYMITV